jgi:hypothetical protein
MKLEENKRKKNKGRFFCTKINERFEQIIDRFHHRNTAM